MLLACYKNILNIVLVIFNIFYVFIIHLGRFLFILVSLIILFFIAYYSDIHQIELVLETVKESVASKNLQAVKESVVSNNLKEGKTHHLLEYNDDDNDGYYSPEVLKSTLYAEAMAVEAIAYEAISSNIVAFYKNNFLEAFPNSEVFVLHRDMAAGLAN